MFLVGTNSEAVKSQLNITIPDLLNSFKIPFTNFHPFTNIINIPELLVNLSLKFTLSADFTRFVILGIILLLFLLYRPEGVIPEPKSNNESYLTLLTNDERADSDSAVFRNQSSGEKDRIQSQFEPNETEET